MAASVSTQTSPYEQYVAANADAFSAYLRRALGSQEERRGGRVSAADALQDAFVAILREWPQWEGLGDDDRDRRAYRCVRDAAGQALRRE